MCSPGAVSPSVPLRPRPPLCVYPSAEAGAIQYFYSFVLETGAGAAVLVLPYTIQIMAIVMLFFTHISAVSSHRGSPRTEPLTCGQHHTQRAL